MFIRMIVFFQPDLRDRSPFFRPPSPSPQWFIGRTIFPRFVVDPTDCPPHPFFPPLVALVRSFLPLQLPARSHPSFLLRNHFLFAPRSTSPSISICISVSYLVGAVGISPPSSSLVPYLRCFFFLSIRFRRRALLQLSNDDSPFHPGAFRFLQRPRLMSTMT